jgi:hypothetical protein
MRERPLGIRQLLRRVTPRRRRALAAAVALITAGLLVAGCGGGAGSPGVAGAGSSSTSAAKPSSGGSSKGGALAFSRCMRSHGVPDFPDPKSNGTIQVNAGPGSDLGPGNPQFKRAQRACQPLLPAPSAEHQHEEFAAALRFAACMRSHGVPNFPDPAPPSSGPQTGSGGRGSAGGGNNLGTNGVDPNSPQFRAANRACRSLTPGGGGVIVSGSPGS